MLGPIADVIGILTALIAVVSYLWKHRDTLADWLYIARYQLTRPFKKDSFNEGATLDVKVVGVIRSRHDPYSGKWISAKRNVDWT